MAPDLEMTLASLAETTLHCSRSDEPKARRFASSKVGTTTVLPVAYHIAFSTACLVAGWVGVRGGALVNQSRGVVEGSDDHGVFICKHM